jgi:MFS family permease
LAHLIKPELRSDVFAWYVVLGSVGNAAGKLAAGWVVQELQTGWGWSPVKSYRAVFLAYAVLGLMNFLLSRVLSSKVELHGHTPAAASISEDEPLLSESRAGSGNEAAVVKEKRALLPRISKDSRPVLLKLCLLFAVDSLASGLVSTYVSPFLVRRFHRGFLTTVI